MMFKVLSLIMCRSIYYCLCFLIALTAMVMAVQPPVMPNIDFANMKPKIETLNKVNLKGKAVPPCIACQNLVKSFLGAVEKTTRQSFAGGDADWEKKKLGTYENSELRLIEIQEMLCSDVELGRDQCYNLAEQYESELEDWFYEKRKKEIDLHNFLCIDLIKVCCPNNTYGPNCIPCPGGIEKPCCGHGKCRKGGTREEPANCVCDAGYTGELCSECDKGYYSELGTSETATCRKCDKSCKDHCRGSGPKNCEVCAPGYIFIPEQGCTEEHSKYDDDDDEDDDTSKDRNEGGNVESSSDTNQSSYTDTEDASNHEKENLDLKSNVDDSSVNTHIEL